MVLIVKKAIYYTKLLQCRPVQRKLIKGTIPTILLSENLKGQQEISLECGPINLKCKVSIFFNLDSLHARLNTQ